ncbi:MAG: hypothetical protein GC172_11335 [Phycisphaera sp.]|nr:hypothetical protein [Phycisphaera sp.]
MFACFSANAEITIYNNDFAGWQAVAGQFTTVDFVEDSQPGFVYFDHYASLGVLLHYEFPFDPAVPFWYRYDTTNSPYGAWLHDNGGILSTGNAPPLRFRFTEAIHAFAALPPTNSTILQLSLYRKGVAIGGVLFQSAPWGTTRGVYSSEAFDEVRFVGNWQIDDIYFQTIPSPGALAVLALAMPLVGRRRR